MPKNWTRDVQDQMKKMKAFAGTVRDYSGVQPAEPEPVSESAEQQLDRIERLLQEKDPYYDLRIYSVKVDVSVQKDLGGEIQETQTEIRGIEGVTTVRTVGITQDLGSTHVATYEIKFELIGTQGRVHYRDRILVPGMMKVKGLRILRVSPMHRTNVRGTIRTVRENRRALKEYGFGGLTGNLSALRTAPSGIMRTPRTSLDQIVADWSAASVMVYDTPVNADDMRYHVMMPVEELWTHLQQSDSPGSNPLFRAPQNAFDGMYQNFIKNGATMPVYVAVGKNGRVKITGNEDLVWYARRAGLEELPVFLSYQKQV
jgi:hypothetical protein